MVPEQWSLVLYSSPTPHQFALLILANIVSPYTPLELRTMADTPHGHYMRNVQLVATRMDFSLHI